MWRRRRETAGGLAWIMHGCLAVIGSSKQRPYRNHW